MVDDKNLFIELIFLIIANILLSLAPLFLVNITNYSVFALTFVRFIASWIIEILLLLFIIYKESKSIGSQREKGFEEYKSPTFKTLLKYYFGPYLKFRNSKTKSRSPQLLFFAIMGIMLVGLSVPAYYFGFESLGVIFTSVAVNIATLVFVAIYGIVTREEEFDILKLVYMGLLITSIFTASFGQGSAQNIKFTYEGSINLAITTIAWIIFLIMAGKSSVASRKDNKMSQFLFTHKTKYYGTTRSLIQLSWVHFFGSISLFPICLIYSFMGPGSDTARQAIQFLTMKPQELIQLIITPGMFGLIILCSIIPYLLIFISASSWPKSALKHDLWNSMLTLFEPLLGLYIGFLIWKETIRTDYMAITTILLFSSLIIRYFYETASRVEYYFFVKIHGKHIYNFVAFIRKIKGFDTFYSLAGQWDILANFTCRSSESFNQIYTKFENNADIKDFQFGTVKKHIIRKGSKSNKN